MEIDLTKVKLHAGVSPLEEPAVYSTQGVVSKAVCLNGTATAAPAKSKTSNRLIQLKRNSMGTILDGIDRTVVRR